VAAAKLLLARGADATIVNVSGSPSGVLCTSGLTFCCGVLLHSMEVEVTTVSLLLPPPPVAHPPSTVMHTPCVWDTHMREPGDHDLGNLVSATHMLFLFSVPAPPVRMLGCLCNRALLC
jgi:hypothetical protein